MAEDDNIDSLKLRISVTHDGSLLEAQNDKKFRWTRERSLAHFPAENVALYKSPQGGFRVVKQIRCQNEETDYRGELRIMMRILKGVEAQHKELFVDLVGWFSSDRYIHFVLEYCQYGDISQHPTPMLEIEAWCVCNQLIGGLSNLHRLGIIHRDIKPQNVLVSDINPIRVKIADFGISKLAHKDNAQLPTQPTTKIGTPGYMAPERLGLIKISGSSHTCALDIWSLGCLIHYLLTDKVPFIEQGRRIHNPYKPLEEYSNGGSFPDDCLIKNRVSLSGRSFLQRLLAPFPKDRPLATEHLILDWELPPISASRTFPPLEPPTPFQLPTSSSVNTLDSQEQLAIEDFMKRLELNDPSSELWHFMKSDNVGRLDRRRLHLLLSSDASPEIYFQGYTALHIAAEQGSAESVEELLRHCNDPNIRTQPHQEALIHLATMQADYGLFERKLQLLLDNGADIDARNLEGDTALHLAIRRMQTVDASKLLLQKGASTEARGRHKRTPIHYAIYLEREEIADLLLEGGANPNCEDEDGVTPLHTAVKSNRISTSFVERLIENVFDINKEDKNRHTPLFEAAVHGRVDFMRILVDNGARCCPHSARLEARISQAHQRPLFNIRIPWLF
ncbi:kinase-like domain-containing protein [Aspergillus taichungensis]|uniref:protein S-acyltransferase n=1 Tax=Aspergillus taichungensis TaxID=482145 RepID=A0A2J5I3W9_9EURO|nr:kinase-like domain-containing protein [Aspergillus taichungensis]